MIPRASFFLIVVFISQGFSQTGNSICISEVMFNPDAANSEYIEIYNNSENILNLSDLKIKYHTSSPDNLTSSNNNYLLHPGRFALLMEKDYNFSNGIYSATIPDSVLIFTTSDNSFGSNGMANSSNRTITLINNNDTLDVYTYTANNSKGYSDEKILSADSSVAEIWTNSLFYNGTPGFRNSCEPFDYDLKIVIDRIDPNPAASSKPVTIEYTIINLGILPAQHLNVIIYHDSNNNSVGEVGEILTQKYKSKLDASETHSNKIILRDLTSGQNNFVLEVKSYEDQNPTNNNANFSIIVVESSFQFNDLVINEVMFEPKDGQPEWIEFYNRSAQNINLKNCIIRDKTNSIKITDDDYIIFPESYFLVTDDESLKSYYNFNSPEIILSLPALNNSGDEIVVSDSLGVIIDSLDYSNLLSGSKSGNSLERISVFELTNSPMNWSFSINRGGATPGCVNSVSKKSFDISIVDFYTENHQPGLGDKTKLNCSVKNSGSEVAEFQLELNVLMENQVVELERSPLIYLIPNDSVSFKFNTELTIDDVRQCYLQVNCELDENNYDNVDTLVIVPAYSSGQMLINEIMFLPGGDEPEWVELYNKSNYLIDLINWKISDVLSSPVSNSITGKSIKIPAGSYLVIARDSLIYNYHEDIPSPVLITNIANLNNGSDGVVIKDYYDNSIDSIFYANPELPIGYSLERVSFNLSSTDPLNWRRSYDYEKSTPGRRNSFPPEIVDLKIDSVIVIPQKPMINEEVDIYGFVSNIGTCDVSELKLEFCFCSLEDTALFSLTHSSIQSGTSKKIQYPGFKSISDKLEIEVKVITTNDKDLSNNSKSITIYPGYPKKSLVINEIMFDPNSGEQEWIELMNNSDFHINLDSFNYCDFYPSKNIQTLTNTNYYLSPGEYVLIATSTNGFLNPLNNNVIAVNSISLNNTEDIFGIYDGQFNLVDSIKYNEYFSSEKGFSIERFSANGNSSHPSNWGVSICESGSTPGYQNSVCDILQYSLGDIIINEIMFDPSSENTEFVELYNPNGYNINIGGWVLGESNNNLFNVSQTSKTIPAGEYYVIAADSSILNNYNISPTMVSVLNETSLSLSNTDDLITIKDYFGNLIDSISYNADWHNLNYTSTKNRSLERINPDADGNYSDNWSTSVDKSGATPGLPNSIYTQNNVSYSSISISPSPFSPDNDGFEDYTSINYNIEKPVVNLRVRVFDSRGRLVRTLENLSPSGSSGTIIFDGKNNDGKALRIGIYILLFEAYDEFNKSVAVFKKPFVIARKL